VDRFRCFCSVGFGEQYGGFPWMLLGVHVRMKSISRKCSVYVLGSNLVA
jgi:hypothetical protein